MDLKIYYVHPQSGHILFVDTLCQVAAGLHQQKSAENIDTDGYTDT